jgi:uncharacterized membrane protein
MPVCRKEIAMVLQTTRRLPLTGALLGLLAMALAGPARAGVGFEGLGTLMGPDIFSEPYAVSASGSIIVGASRSEESAPGVEAFHWTPTGGMSALRETAPTMGRSSTACGISADGCTVVGRASDSTLYGFRWSPTTGMVRLRDGEGGLWGTQAWGISANGAVTVGQVGEDEFARAAAWYDSDITATDLGFSAESVAKAASSTGHVIVGYARHGPMFEAFRWTHGGGAEFLGNLGSDSFANAVSAEGRVVVGSAYDPLQEHQRAIRWTAKTGVEALPAPAGSLEEEATGVSRGGEVILGYYSIGYDRACFWTDEGVRDLQDYLVTEAGLDLTGWTLYRAVAVSADGRTLVGVGRDPEGGYEGWVAHLPKATALPEPATLALMALGGLAALLRRRPA